MNYEEKYKKALETIQEILDSGSDSIKISRLRLRLQNVFPELKESEKIRNKIIDIIKSQKEQQCHIDGTIYDEMIVWLEKQGQEDPCKDCKYPTLNCHNFPCSKKQKYQGKSALEAAKEEKVDNSNKVKPKFHKGDFIRHNKANIIYKVILVNGSFYYIENIETSVRIGLFNVEQNFHLWTIADAKDGDILTFGNNVCIMGIIICKSPTSYDTKSYCRLIDEHFIGKEESGWDSRLLVPATKEQCELLFSKMKEDSYEWDSEKKELRKIETIDIPFSAKDSELIEATYFIPKGFHAEIVNNKVIIKKD